MLIAKTAKKVRIGNSQSLDKVSILTLGFHYIPKEDDYDSTRGRRGGYFSPITFAKVYAYLGETDQVFEQLEKAYDEHDAGLLLGRSRLAYHLPLRADPRFQDLALTTARSA